MPKLSVSEKLLLAALDLVESGKVSFSAEDLVVAAWGKFPDTFGLSGYYNDDGRAKYPDSNRVFAEIMGSKPIRKKGLIRKVGTKIYKVTEAGFETGKWLRARDNSGYVEKSPLSRNTVKEIKRLLSSRAVGKTRNDRSSEITFYDACAFWGITPRSTSIELEGRLANFEKIIATSFSSLRGEEKSFVHGGIPIGSNDLEMLRNVHKDLLARFQNEINIINKRKDERI
jgi:hypothetical protein